VVLARLCFGAITYMESASVSVHSLLQRIQLFQGEWITSSVRLLAVIALIYMCVTKRWGFSPKTETSPPLGEPMLQPQS
jgi:hypothetical protein